MKPAWLFSDIYTTRIVLCKQRIFNTVCVSLAVQSPVICVPTAMPMQCKHHNSKSHVFTSVDLIARHQRSLKICLRAPGVTKDWKKKYTLFWQLASFLSDLATQCGLHWDAATINYSPSQFPLSRWLLLMHKI